jgi:hypothetical protein
MKKGDWWCKSSSGLGLDPTPLNEGLGTCLNEGLVGGALAMLSRIYDAKRFLGGDGRWCRLCALPPDTPPSPGVADVVGEGSGGRVSLIAAVSIVTWPALNDTALLDATLLLAVLSLAGDSGCLAPLLLLSCEGGRGWPPCRPHSSCCCCCCCCCWGVGLRPPKGDPAEGIARRLDRLLDRQPLLPPSVPVLSPSLPRLHALRGVGGGWGGGGGVCAL